jgi:hypothetical protein
MDASCNLVVLFLGLQPQTHMNAPDDENIFFQLDFTHGFAHKSPRGRIDLTRLQRASKGSRKSTRSRGDNVIERRSTRFCYSRRNLIVLRDGAMDSENDRLRFSG